MSSEDQIVQNNNTGRKYFAMIPRMADDDLTIYEYRLYGHYSQVCGQDGGKCTETEKTTYKICGMSRNTFVKARQGLIEKGFIQMIPAQAHEPGKVGHSATIKVVDRWLDNVKRYSVDTSNQNPSDGGHFKSEPLKGHEVKRPPDVDTSNQNPNKNKEKQLQEKVVVVSETILRVFLESEVQTLLDRYGLERLEAVCAHALQEGDVPARWARAALSDNWQLDKPSKKTAQRPASKSDTIEDDGMRYLQGEYAKYFVNYEDEIETESE